MGRKTPYIVLLLFAVGIASNADNYADRQLVEKSLQYLRQSQLENGAFVSVVRNSTYYAELHTPFANSIIGYSLLTLRNDFDVEDIIIKSAGYVDKNRYNESELWAFFDNSSKNSRFKKLPPDLDDTSNAVIFLHKAGYEINRTDINRLLNFKRSDGHFLVWVQGDSSQPALRPTEADCVADASVFTMFHLFNTTLGKTCEAINEVIKAGSHDSCTLYYHTSDFPFAYFASRAYSEGAYCIDRDALRELIIAKQRSDMTALDSCMSLTSLVKLGYRGDVNQKLYKATKEKSKEGVWDHNPFFSDKLNLTFFGSSQITTVLCAEAVWSYQKLGKS